MKNLKRLFSLLLALSLLLTCAPYMPLMASAANIVASGTCGAGGDNLTWTLDDEGTLTISGNGAMKNYTYSSSAPWYSSRSTIKKVLIGDSVTTIGDISFYQCYCLVSVEIGNSVTTIGDNAFHSCNALVAVTIPDSVTTIGDGAFCYCTELTSVTIPDSVTIIETGIFAGCSKLTSVTIPDSVTTIGRNAFLQCSALSSIAIPDSVTVIESYAFYFCSNLTSVTIPDSVAVIGKGAFSSCASLLNIYANGGNYCDVDGVLFSAGKETIVCFPGGKSGTYAIPDSVTTLESYAFQGCDGITSVTIPNSVTSIGDYAFAYCGGLTSVTIPESVTTIRNSAFEFCSKLKEIYFNGSAPAIGNNAFYNMTATAYYYPDDTWTEAVMQNYSGTITWVARERKQVRLETTAETLNRGDTFTVDAVLTNSGDIRVGSVALDYDADALELIGGTSHVEGANPGTVIVDKQVGTFFVSEAAAVSGKIFTFEFRVKDDAAFGDYPISVTAAIGADVGETIDATGVTVSVACDHEYGKWEKEDATNHKRTCTVCKTHTETEPHNYSSVVTPPTCTDQGYTTHTCSVCGDTYKDTYVKENGHTYGDWEQVDDTYHKRTCTVCKTHTETATHDWDGGVVTTAATCKDTGIRTYACATCTGTKTEIIPVTDDHVFGKWEQVDETYHKHTCTVCKTHSETEKHNFGEDHVCTDCGYKAYTVGDFDGDGLVTDADVIWLLWYTVFPEDYPLNQSGDFDGDGLVTDADVIYLLWHTVFPEDYPLKK